MKTKLWFVMLLFSMTAGAQEENLKMRFDFENVSGTSVKDDISGITAKTVGAAKVVEMGDFHVLDLGNASGYFDLTKNAGSIVRQLEDFTVSVYYRVNENASLSGAGYFLWCFSQSAANTADASPYTAYRLNAQRMATSTGGYNHETGMETGTESAKGRWIHFLYRQRGTTGQVFLNGRQMLSQSGMPVLKQTFTAVPAYCWIGRAPFSGDSYLKQTLIYDFRLYDAALADAEVTALAAVADELETSYRYGVSGDFTALQTKLDEVKDFLATDLTAYADGAIGQLRDELNLSEKEIVRGRASQTLIDLRLKNLTSALISTQKTAGFTMAETCIFTPEGHGFRHPGGMVTEADINRIKAALAAGDTRIKRAYEILCQNEYSQSGTATWPVWEIIRGGSSGQNYMNAARGAAIAFQNALRWRISGDRAHADNAVRALMNWAHNNKYVGGDTNKSLAAGLYGYGFAQAAELVRDYDGWSRTDFEEFKRYMLTTWYPVALDFLRRRHDTWLNARYANLGERPGHYWSNWGLCNALCLMSIGILCDDVHIYNQGVSFYKYDHVGTYNPNRTTLSQILNDGCDEFLGNLVPVLTPDERGPFGYLGQMQESGRDQGHALMALGLAVDICQTGFSQGDDLFAYMDDRIAAGAEFVAASNFGGVDAASLPWKNYNYADCRGTMGAGWLMTGVNTGGSGEYRPYWDRLIGYYEGLRGVKMQYSEAASAKICPDGGGGNYSQNSGGFDHLGFSTLTHWRPAIEKADAITPLSGDIIYKGVTYKNQTNLGGLKYTYRIEKTRAIPADGADITLIPQLPADTEDTGLWQWESGETTRQLTVKADRSHIYRVTYTAANGTTSEQSFAIAVAGDAVPDVTVPEITVDGTIYSATEQTVLYGQSVILYLGNSSGWTDDYRWSTGAMGSSVIVIPNITEDRTYTCQYVNQGGYVNEQQFHLHVIPARPFISIGGTQTDGETSALVFAGTEVILGLTLPDNALPEEVTWQDGTHGRTLTVSVPIGLPDGTPLTYTAIYLDKTYTFTIDVKAAAHSYYDLLSSKHGYTRIDSEAQLFEAVAAGSYFVIASDEADLLVGLRANAPHNGNRAFFYQSPTDPLTDLRTVFQFESFDGGYVMRNIDYDGLLLQTEYNAPQQWRTHDQPYAISWARFLPKNTGGAWTIENGTYPGNWLGLWTPANGYCDGEELACNKTGDEIAHFQLFAIPRARFHTDYVDSQIIIHNSQFPLSISPLLASPDFAGNGWPGWTVTGTWGNQRFNGAAEVWHSTDFSMQQTLTGLPAGSYTVTCQMANGEGSNTGYLFATAGGETTKAVVKQSCAGSDFDTQRNKMASDATYGQLSVNVTVGDEGQLTLGIKEPTSGTTWLVWDNFTLTYQGPAPDRIEQIVNSKSSNSECFDLSGRKMIKGNLLTSKLPKGVYIINGKKVIVK